MIEKLEMNIKMKLKYLLTISLAVFLSACTQQNNDVPIQSNNDGYGKPVVVVNKHYYQTKPKVRVSRYKRK